jgi:hypothetical protein
MKIMDIKKPMEDMTEDELLLVIRRLRAERIIKAPPTKERIAKKKASVTTSLQKLLAKLSPEQLAALKGEE